MAMPAPFPRNFLLKFIVMLPSLCIDRVWIEYKAYFVIRNIRCTLKGMVKTVENGLNKIKSAV